MKAIRPAIPSDLPKIMQMLRNFYDASCYGGVVDFCERSCADTIAELARSPKHIVLVGEVGGDVVSMAAAVSMPHWANAKQLVAQEMFWWCEPSARGSGIALRLLGGLEAWARSMHCHSFCVASTATNELKPDKLATLYKRRGFVPQDIFYAKRL